MATAREGNIGLVIVTGPLLWAGYRPVDCNHSRLGMTATSGIPNLLPLVAVISHGPAGEGSRNADARNFLSC